MADSTATLMSFLDIGGLYVEFDKVSAALDAAQQAKVPDVTEITRLQILSDRFLGEIYKRLSVAPSKEATAA